MLYNVLAKFVYNFMKKQREKKWATNPHVQIAKSADISPNATIRFGKGVIKIGENVFVNELCALNTCDSTIKIGNDVLIGPGTIINTINHHVDRTDIPILNQGLNEKPIVIEDDTWIGANCTILGGVQIGAHSVIGAHSLVNHSIPPNSVAYGVPCKVIRKR